MILLWCAVHTIFAQELSLSFHHLTKEDGLAYAQQHHVFQDSYGFIWIGTDEGLDRFDGQSVEHFSPNDAPTPEKITSRCFEDADKNLWFSTSSALVCYRRATGTFESFALNKPDATGFLAFYFDAVQRIWVKIGSGLYVFDIKTLQYTHLGPVQGGCFDVITDAGGGVTHVISGMLPKEEHGIVLTEVAHWKTDTIQFKKMPDGRKRRSSPVRGMLVEGDSVVWTALYNGIGKHHLKQRKSVAFTGRMPQITADFGWTFDLIAVDPSRLLVACKDGLRVFDKRQNKFVQQFCSKAWLPNSLYPGEVTALYQAPSNNLWLSGPGGGLAFAHFSKIKFPALSETIGTSTTALFSRKNGKIWCSTIDSGTYVYDKFRKKQFQVKSIKNITQGGTLALLELSAFWEDNRRVLWGMYFNNILQWKPAKHHFEFREENFFGVASSESDYLRANCLLADNTRLVAQGNSIFQVETGKTKVRLLPWRDLEYLQLQGVTAIFQSKKGYVYIGDKPDRILVLDLSSGQARQRAVFKGAGDCASFMEAADGRVWAATSKGLFCVDSEGLQGKLLLEKQDGVPNEQYYNAIPDQSGQLWLTGNNGLICYNPETKTHHRFGTADGLLSNEFNPGAVLTVPETGAFWLGGKKGVNVFRPEDIRLLETRPRPQITRLLVNDTVFNADRDITLLRHLVLNYTENTLSIQFSALDFSAPGQNQYYYRMRGIERDSVFNGTRNFVRYANLPPGEYTFEVWATNSDGVLSPEPRRLQLYIRPPFWQTWWFYALCAAAAGALIYGWFWYRLQQALKIERMRVQISSDLHDDVGTMLAGLAMQSEVLELTARDQDKTKLRRISEASRDAMSRMRDTVWAIDARKDTFEDLTDRIREHAAEILTPRDMRFDISVENIPLKQTLPANVRQALYLICKEAVTNAAKHSNGDTVSVSLKKTGAGFEMRICDNGQTVEKPYKTTGLGISNMQLRAKKIGATLTISREPGFCVTIHST